jgi:hypothetical protein
MEKERLMSEDHLASRMSDITETARLLNEVTEQANATLAAVERHLWQADIGLEVWLDDNELDVLDREIDEKCEDDVEVERRQVLGYVKIGERWRIASRAEKYERRLDSESWLGYSYDPVPIANASRKHRIRALELLPKLLEKVQAEAQRTIQAVNQLISS